MSRARVNNLTAAISGLLFSAGLTVSQMVDPEKVLSFLDFFGNWDPSLALVMGGALLVYSITFRLIRRHHPVPLFDVRFHLPTKTKLDRRLLGGASLFGMGWGVAGICPGPALASLHTGSTSIFAFVAAMLSGMWLVGQHDAMRQRALARKQADANRKRQSRLAQLEKQSSHEQDPSIC